MSDQGAALKLGVAAAVALYVGFLGILGAAVLVSSMGGEATASGLGGEPSAGLPAAARPFLALYKAAEAKYGVPWNLLAAVHYQETKFSAIPRMVSSTGAQGHMQFDDGTWKTYGEDADHNGQVSRWDAADAIFAAAHNLATDAAAAQGNYEEALESYCCGSIDTPFRQKYSSEVLANAQKYAIYTGSTIAGGEQRVAALNVALSLIGRATYNLGSGRSRADQDALIFDCSSFVHYCFSQAGVDLGPATTTYSQVKLGEPVAYEQLEPGDLVFFNTEGPNSHVGIYAGGGKFVGDQWYGLDVRLDDMTSGYWRDCYSQARRL